MTAKEIAERWAKTPCTDSSTMKIVVHDLRSLALAYLNLDKRMQAANEIVIAVRRYREEQNFTDDDLFDSLKKFESANG